MAITSFTADANKTVKVVGETYTLIVPSLPEGIQMYINEVPVNTNDAYEITENVQITFSGAGASGDVSFDLSDMQSCKFNGVNVNSGDIVSFSPGRNTIEAKGVTTIPNVILNGEGLNGFTVNGLQHTPAELPFNWTPQSGQANSLYFNGQAADNKSISIAGTDIETLTINNVDTPLPYSGIVDEDMIIAVAGRIYQVDLDSKGGASIAKDGVIINDGNSTTHQIIDIDKDTYIVLDGTHELTLDGVNLTSATINGVTIEVEDLPIDIPNNKMNLNFTANGYLPSEVHVTGSYLDTVMIDGVNVPLSDNGGLQYELTTIQDNHFIQVVGSQPREYLLTFNNNNSTEITANGNIVSNMVGILVSNDTYIEANAIPIPVNFSMPENGILVIDGRTYYVDQYTHLVSKETFVDFSTDSCRVTINYGDDSLVMLLPQAMVNIGAPHMNYWIFDGWSSNDVGITNPKSKKALIDLRGRSFAVLTAHYQRCETFNKPNMLN